MKRREGSTAQQLVPEMPVCCMNRNSKKINDRTEIRSLIGKQKSKDEGLRLLHITDYYYFITTVYTQFDYHEY